jgi:uncharacterized radical SAM superfamily protein
LKTITFSAPYIKRYETGEFRQSSEPKFIAVSLKGNKCSLLCDHCKTKMLSALYKAEDFDKFAGLCEKMAEKGCKGMLITGGCDPDGTIPLMGFVDTISEMKNKYGFKFAAHTKLANEEFVRAVSRAQIDLLMIDLVGDLFALHEVYHLREYDLSHVENSIIYAAKYNVPLAPHIMIGINHGNVEGEYTAIKMLMDKPFETLVLVVLTPLRNTPMARTIINQQRVLKFMEYARKVFPDKRITLGCAKTWGEMQRIFEEKALELEYNAIAYPSEGIVDMARKMGYEINFSEECCAFFD